MRRRKGIIDIQVTHGIRKRSRHVLGPLSENKESSSRRFLRSIIIMNSVEQSIGPHTKQRLRRASMTQIEVIR